MIDRLASALAQAGLESDSIELADLLWVAARRTTGPSDGTPDRSPGEPGDGTSGDESDEPAAHRADRLIGEAAPASPPTDARGYVYPKPVDSGPAPPGAVEIALAAPPALPAQLRLARALRPLKQRRPVSLRSELDVDATVEFFGQTGLLAPQMCPGLERWFDIALVVDGGPTMAVWEQTTHELGTLLANHGAFRNIRQWHLDVRGETPRLRSDAGGAYDLDQLNDATGRQLTLVVSDFVGAVWYGQEIWSELARWGRRSPVVLVHTLPQRLWEATAVGAADVQLTGLWAGQPNQGLRAVLPWWATESAPCAMPVVELREEALSRWARMVMGSGSVSVPGVMAEPPDLPDAAEGGVVADRVAAFKATVSAEAYELAVCLSAVPIRLPIARIVAHACVRSDDPVHVAEVFASGLIQRSEAPADTPTDDVDYDFVDGVRPLLQLALTGTRALDVLRAVARYLEATQGHSPRFSALVGGSVDGEPDPDLQPFADVSGALLARLGIRGAPEPRTTETAGDAADGEAQPRWSRRSDPLQWAQAVLLGDDPELARFRSWLTAPDGGGLPAAQVHFITSGLELDIASVMTAATYGTREARGPLVFVASGQTPGSIGDALQNPETNRFSSRVVIEFSVPALRVLPRRIQAPWGRLTFAPDVAASMAVSTLIDALSGAAALADGTITLPSVHDYAGSGCTITGQELGQVVLRGPAPTRMTSHRAIVVGFEASPEAPSPVRTAERDARDMALALQRSGYDVRLLVGADATELGLLDAVIDLKVGKAAPHTLWLHISADSALWEPGRGMTGLLPSFAFGDEPRKTTARLPDPNLIAGLLDEWMSAGATAVVVTAEVRQHFMDSAKAPRIGGDARPPTQLRGVPLPDVLHISHLALSGRWRENGPLCRVLIDALDEMAPTATLRELSERTQSELRRWAANNDYGPENLVVTSSGELTTTVRRLGSTPEMVTVPGGEFFMGPTERERLELGDTEMIYQRPNPTGRTVYVPEFRISRFPITNEQYASFLAERDRRPPKHWNGPTPPVEIRDHPVVHVSWRHATDFCRWLSELSGENYVLPSTEQWEKAARGTDARRFPWGETLDPSRAYYRHRNTTPVHAHSPAGDSPYGVADMVGNAREWTRSGLDPDDDRVILRGGGAQITDEHELWCCWATAVMPDSGGKATVGFRVVLDNSLASEAGAG